MKSSFTDRICRFELMEPRRLLAADVSLGAIAGQVAMAEDGSGVESVVLRLLGETGDVVGETQTNVAGNYRFADLSPGIYAVLEIQPPGVFDGGSVVGSGGGMRLDNNLLGEIVVYAGSDLVGYDFRELAADELSESGVLVDRPLVAHSVPVSGSEETLLADAALWQLYGSQADTLVQSSLPLEPTVLIAATIKKRLPLPATGKASSPFFGSLGNGRVKRNSGDGNNDGLESIDILQEGLWELEFDSNGWLTATNQVVRPVDTGEEPVESDWNDDGIDDVGFLRKGLWILAGQANQELNTQDYDRAFELSEAEEEIVGLRR